MKFVAGLSSCGLLILGHLGLCLAAQCPSKYAATMAPQAQMALAASAAPADVSRRATIYALTQHGYSVLRPGTNGFSCIVDRQRLDTIEPECFDAVGTATLLRARLFTEAQRSKGLSDSAIQREVDLRFSGGQFRAPTKSGIVYMLSDCNRVYDPDAHKVIAFPGHLMFYAPFMSAKDLGYPVSSNAFPYLVDPGKPYALIIVVPSSHPK